MCIIIIITITRPSLYQCFILLAGGQGGEYFEMSSDMMKHHSEAPPDDNGVHTSDVKKPLIEQ